MAIKNTISTIARTSKIYQNWDFWFENIPSGNTAQQFFLNYHPFTLAGFELVTH
jgi:hypothetical protein